MIRTAESPASAESVRRYVAQADPRGYALVIHGGAGNRVEQLTAQQHEGYAAGLRAAYDAGDAVLRGGGSAVDAVCAAVESLENDPLFNAGRGAALTARGEAELDASVMTGDGRAGAVAASRAAKSPVRLARAVLERSQHVFLVDPSRSTVTEWGLDTIGPDYFVTKARQEQLARIQSEPSSAPRHGTVGAVALDADGHLAAATSTGGIVNQNEGRVGDTPIIGAGNYARDGVVAVSCTGEGEAFIEGVVSHEIYARMRYLASPVETAVVGTIADEVGSRDAFGGIIAVDAAGNLVVAHNSNSMFAAYSDGDRVVILT